MNTQNWTSLIGWLAAELAVLAAAARLLQFCFPSPRAGRILWLSAFTGMAMVLVVELSGARANLPQSISKERHRVTITTSDTPAPNQALKSSARPTAPEPAPIFVQWPGWLWLAGAGLLLARSMAARIWLGVRRRSAQPANEEIVQLIARLQTALGLRKVQSQVWPDLRGPVTFGVFNATVALPPDFVSRFSSAERETMLAHEMAHLAARDPFWMLVSDLVIALAWWHPLVWWARHRLQTASEAAADEASTLVPGGPCVLAECLVRLGRELTAPGPARALGIGGNGPNSQLALRITRLLREPRAWRPVSFWAKWLPRLSAVLVALASAALPIQTGLTGSILAAFAAAVPVRAETPPATPTQISVTNNIPAAIAPPPAVVAVGTDYVTLSRESELKETNSVCVATNIVGIRLVLPETSEPASNVQSAIKHAAAEKPSVKLMVQAVSLAESDWGGIGLDWIFGQTPADNPSMETSHDWKLLPESFINSNSLPGLAPPSANHPRNVVIDHLRTDGQSAILSAGQYAALRERIIAKTGADVLTNSTAITLSGRRVRLAVQDLGMFVTGVEASDASFAQQARINYRTDPVGLGFIVDIFPEAFLPDWRLRVQSSVTYFLGYDDHEKSAAQKTLPLSGVKYEEPQPHFLLVEADAAEAVKLGETLAIRGPFSTETTKTKAHFFSRTKTKTTRHRLFVFVTPVSP